MIKPFEDAVFAMKPGQIAMVETHFGFHVVKLEASTPAHTDTLAEARPKIIEEMRTQAGAKLGREAAQEDLTAAIARRQPRRTWRRSAESRRSRRRCLRRVNQPAASSRIAS